MDRRVITGHLEAAATATDSDAKGKAYESVVAYVFGSVPGCIVESGITNVFGTEQIDVAVGNSRLAGGLTLMPSIFLIECKDWDRPVDSKTVGYFVNILASRGVEVGVLVAANGITGELRDLTYAHSLGLSAAARGIKVLVVTTVELAALTTVEDFVQLLHRRLLRAYATGTIGVP
jgi:hypothetical protein